MKSVEGQRYLLKVRGHMDPFIADELVEDQAHILVSGRWQHKEGSNDAHVRFYGRPGWRTFSKRSVEEVRPLAGGAA
jgi:hypothetical protein